MRLLTAGLQVRVLLAEQRGRDRLPAPFFRKADGSRFSSFRVMNPKKKIFVVDDDQMARALLFEFLNNGGFDVHLLASGKDALQTIESDLPDLLLLDVNMPEMDGLEVLRRLRANPATKFLPVIFLTGSDLDTNKIIEALDLDPSDFLTKLVSSKELIARVEWVLRRSANKDSTNSATS